MEGLTQDEVKILRGFFTQMLTDYANKEPRERGRELGISLLKAFLPNVTTEMIDKAKALDDARMLAIEKLLKLL